MDGMSDATFRSVASQMVAIQAMVMIRTESLLRVAFTDKEAVAKCLHSPSVQTKYSD